MLKDGPYKKVNEGNREREKEKGAKEKNPSGLGTPAKKERETETERLVTSKAIAYSWSRGKRNYDV